MDAAAAAKKERKKKKKSKKKSNQSSVQFCIVDGSGAVKEVIKKKKRAAGDDPKKDRKKKRRKDDTSEAAPAAPAAAPAAPPPAAAPTKTKTADNPMGATRLFMGNLPWAITDEQLSEACGCELRAIKRITDKESGKFYGSVFIEASDPQSAGAAVKKNGLEVGGRVVKIAFAPPRPGDVWPPRPGPQASGPDAQPRQKEVVVREKTPRPAEGTLKLFIGNVAYEATEPDVRKLFEPVAPIRGVRWVNHKDSGDFRGCGYLTFDSCEETDAALAKLDGAELCGRRIRLDYTE